MNSDGTLKARQKVSQDSGNLNLTFSSGYGFGKSITALGDLDGDGVIDLAVSAIGPGNNTGAVYILFMNKNGTVKSTKTIDPSNSLLSSYLTGGNFLELICLVLVILMGMEFLILLLVLPQKTAKKAQFMF